MSQEKKSIQNKTKLLVICAVLSAFGILIPLVIPKIPVIPGIMTVTIASHVPVMLAMLINPFAAAAVALVTAVGFLISTTPVVAIRALSHIIFALTLSLFAKKLIKKKYGAVLLCVLAALIHAAAETFSVYICTFIFKDAFVNIQLNFFYFFVAIGLVTFAHSTVDFILAYFIYAQLKRNRLID